MCTVQHATVPTNSETGGMGGIYREGYLQAGSREAYNREVYPRVYKEGITRKYTQGV